MSTTYLTSQNGRSAAIAGLLAISIIFGAMVVRQRIDVAGHRIASASATDVVKRPPAVATVTPTAPVTQTNRIFRERDGIHIDVRSMPRQLAAERLATLTGSRILGDASLLAHAGPLDLHWQGTDVAAAWKQVLGTGLGHSIHCSGSACTIRILSIDEIDGGTVLVPEPVEAARSATAEPPTGLMNRPTDPDAIDESSLDP